MSSLKNACAKSAINSIDAIDSRPKARKQSLLKAAKAGSLKDVEVMLLRNGLNLNVCTQDGAGLLHLAVGSGNKLLIEFLLKKGLSAERRFKSGSKTPLDIVRERVYTNEIVQILEQDISINKRDENGMTSLHRAAYEGNSERLRALIEQGANLRVRDNEGNTPLHLAAKRNRTDIIYTLIMITDRNDPLGDILYEPDENGLIPFDVAEASSYARKLLSSLDPYRKPKADKEAFFAAVLNKIYQHVRDISEVTSGSKFDILDKAKEELRTKE